MNKLYTLNLTNGRIRMYDKKGKLHFEAEMTKEMADLLKSEDNEYELLGYIEKTYKDVIKDLP